MADPLIIEILRPLDLLAIRLELHNLRVLRTTSGEARIVEEIDGPEGIVVVHFPPQHVVEEHFRENAPLATPIRALVSGPSRLAFRIPSRLMPLAFTLEALLDWSRWDPLVVDVARPRGESFGPAEPKPKLRPPEATETAIELPYRVVLSPSFLGGWVHATHPVMHKGRAELWHTRLAVRRQVLDDITISESDAEDRDVRAVWSPDLVEPAPDTIETTLHARRRGELVKVSADFADQKNEDESPYTPEPVAVDRLMLTSVGGWLQAKGEWPDVQDVNLTAWSHRATQGRDHFVRVAERGVLYPLGHAATHVVVSERQIEEPEESDGPVALVRSQHFVVVRQPERTYEKEPYKHNGREWPFLHGVRFLTTFSQFQPLEIEDTEPEEGDARALWILSRDVPLADAPPLPFALIGRDAAGRDVHARAGLIFVPITTVQMANRAERTRKLELVDRAYGQRDRGVLTMGQSVALAPPGPGGGDTTLATDRFFVRIQLDETQPGTQGRLPFRPALGQTTARVRAISRLAGGSGRSHFEYADAYLRHGLDDPANNAAQIFLQTMAEAIDVRLPAERGAALASPELGVRALSRHLGPLAGDLEALAAGTFDPRRFLRDSSRVLGAVSLGDLVAGIAGPDAQGLANQVPKMVTVDTPSAVVTTLDWAPDLASRPPPPLEAREGVPMTLTLRTVLEQPLGDGQPRSTSVATLRDFAFNFLDVLKVHFRSLTFTSETGRKTDVSADLDPDRGVEFLGPLQFLNALRRFIPADGFSDPPAVDIGPTGVTVGYSLPLPPLSVAVFALENVRLGASLHLPFTTGAARLRFSFSERHERFVLTVSGLGGGGFFGMALGLDGIEMIEAALEFGAHVGMDFGVASGGVTIMAGVYFRYEEKDTSQAVQVTGYVRLAGEVEVLGLISVSVELFLGLSYHSNPERLEGEATLVIKVDLTLFSESVELTVRRSFAKAANDPGFGAVMDRSDWALYAGAFA